MEEWGRRREEGEGAGIMRLDQRDREVDGWTVKGGLVLTWIC